MKEWHRTSTRGLERALLDALGEWTEHNRAGAWALGDPKRSERQREFRLALGEFVGNALSYGAGSPPPRDDVMAFTLGNIVDSYRDIFPARGMKLDDILSLPPPGPDSWVVDRVARHPAVSMNPVDPKVGKSWMWRCIAAAVSSELREVLGRSIAVNMPVLFVELDEPDASVFEHYKLLDVRGAPGSTTIRTTAGNASPSVRPIASPGWRSTHATSGRGWSSSTPC